MFYLKICEQYHLTEIKCKWFGEIVSILTNGNFSFVNTKKKPSLIYFTFAFLVFKMKV